MSMFLNSWLGDAKNYSGLYCTAGYLALVFGLHH